MECTNTKLKEKSIDFDVPQEVIDEKEEGRLLFISKFPLDAIKDLELDQYVQGTDENSFCYWLEFNYCFKCGEKLAKFKGKFYSVVNSVVSFLFTFS